MGSMKIEIDIPREVIESSVEEIRIRIGRDGAGTIRATMTAGDGGATGSAGRTEGSGGGATGLAEMMSGLIGSFGASGRSRLAETYASALHSFMRYREGRDVELGEIDREMMGDYEEWMRRRGLTQNTSSFYMRILRATYNRAVRAGRTRDRRPFDGLFTGHARTIKRAVAQETIREIGRARLSDERERLARDVFMFSFYTRGMSFVDIANLKRSDLRNGYIIYKRKKTGQTLRIAWHERMQRIIERHPSKDGIHLLGLLDATKGTDLRRQYRASQWMINGRLKVIARRLGLRVNLTMYVARHSWATIARDLHVPLSVISDGMGHGSERTTQIYLKSIDAEEIDRSNERIMEEVE